ncbi:MAG: pitrilysin family protein [Pseudomonadota bacterium]
MKFSVKNFCTMLLAAAALFVAPPASAANFLNGLEKGGLPRVTPPPVRVIALDNGMTCFLLEDHTLPMVQMKVVARAGSIYDPADKVGLAELAGMLMRSGGAGGLSPDEFDAAVDAIGAKLASGIGLEMGDASLAVLTGDLEKGAELLFDMIFKPRLDEGRLKVSRMKIEERLRREEDEPDEFTAKSFRQLTYGKENPWARRPDNKSLGRVSVENIRTLHGNFFKTGNLMLSAAGDFKTDELVALIRRLTKDAPRGTAEIPAVPEVKLEFEPRVDQIVRPLTQSFIRMGHLGVRRHNPDRFALLLMSDILGANNFKSRLMEDIRTKRGLAYSIWSDVSPATDYGLFTIGVDTKAGQASAVIDLIRGHLKRLSGGNDVAGSELSFAKQSVLSRLVFEFDSSFKVVDRRAIFRFYGYPDNYWQVFHDRIARVRVADVEDVARRYLHPDGLNIVVVGPKVEGLK